MHIDISGLSITACKTLMNSEKEGQRFTHLNLSTAIGMSYYRSNLVIENMRDDKKREDGDGHCPRAVFLFFSFLILYFQPFFYQ